MAGRIIAFIMSIVTMISSFFTGLFNIGYYEMKDVSYGAAERQKFDLWLPKNTGETGIIIYIHGGGWTEGSKNDYCDAAERACREYKIAAATVGYRFAGSSEQTKETDCSGILEDIGAALETIKAKALEKGVKINRAIFTGASAGGHISLLYAYKFRDTALITPVAVADFCGPADFNIRSFYNSGSKDYEDYVCGLVSRMCGFDFTMETIDSAKPYLDEISPISYVDTAVPTVIAHGMKDEIVPYENAVALDRALTEKGIRHDFISFPNSGHSLDRDPEAMDAAWALLHQYAREYLGAK